MGCSVRSYICADLVSTRKDSPSKRGAFAPPLPPLNPPMKVDNYGYLLKSALVHPPLTWNILVFSSRLLVLVSLSVLGCLYPDEVGQALYFT